MSLHLTAVDLVGNARQTLRQKRDAEKELQILQKLRHSQVIPVHACARSSRRIWE